MPLHRLLVTVKARCLFLREVSGSCVLYSLPLPVPPVAKSVRADYVLSAVLGACCLTGCAVLGGHPGGAGHVVKMEIDGALS